MNTSPARKPNKHFLEFITVLLWFLRLLFRLREFTSPKHKRAKYREFREKMQAMDRDKREMLRQIDENPSAAMETYDEFFNRHASPGTQLAMADHHLKMHMMRLESDALLAIRTDAGDDTRAAIDGYRQYIQSHPESRSAYFWLGIMLGKAEDWDGSLEALWEAERLETNSPHPLPMTRIHIGEILRKKGDLKAAENQLRDIAENPPQEFPFVAAIAYLRLGDVLHEQGKRAEARSAWKQAAKRDDLGSIRDAARKQLAANR